jgi:hypothetical protein
MLAYSIAPLIMPLRSKTTPLIGLFFKCIDIANTTKLSHNREDIPIIKPIFHCRKVGQIKGGLLYYIYLYYTVVPLEFVQKKKNISRVILIMHFLTTKYKIIIMISNFLSATADDCINLMEK